jgi:SP family myo-inositol transporter-like MFS transporter 13
MADTAAEPLISNTREFPDDEQLEGEGEDVAIDESTLVSPGQFIWSLAVCAGVSGLLFGYEYVVASSQDYRVWSVRSRI